MFLAGSKKRADQTAVNPFQAQVTANTAPAGPGVGVPREELFTGALSRRRRWAAQVLGDTPPRDGPFAQAAAPIAIAFPPKTRQAVRRAPEDPGGINPFR
jgi:hypothetical protein